MSHCSGDTIQLADGKHAAARERVAAGLDGDSTLDSGRPDNTSLDLTIAAPATGELPGGLSGRTSLGASFIEMFHLPRTLRRPGVGSDLLLRAEAGARRRGGDHAVR
ncbi:GNAT family N-acetyltransferase [Burkholderia plantarii]|uniref:GNAT family N-acetyltransferase n=1 Tax=Burkholderia plantarii TaxID=41899 RepID=UPI00209AF42D|nr:GNAT family N-acetyltransferase [Burkholderia plantarii]